MPAPSEYRAIDRYVERIYRRLGPRYVWAFVAAISAAALFFTVLGALAIYGFEAQVRDVFGRTLVVGAACGVVAVAIITIRIVFTGPFRPLLRWMTEDEHTPAEAVDAWRAATTAVLPLVAFGALVFSVCYIPAEVYFILALDIPLSSIPAVILTVEIMICGAALVDYFIAEELLRPGLREVAAHLPADFELSHVGLPMRRKLFAAVSLITLATATVVAAAQSPTLAPTSRAIVGVGSAMVLTLTISLLLTTFLTRAVVSPVEQLLAASRRVREGDLAARVAVMSSDELGVLSQSFNEMIEGLQEREALSAAMGSYVDPTVAGRVLREGQLLQGEEVEVTLMFLDIRNFTGTSEDLSAADTVAFLNEFFELVVPIIAEHGGHANKFLGDGLLAVFGAPEPHPDHADRAVTAARAIARRVREAYGDRLRIGIGVNSGRVIAGTLGGGGRLEFGLIGDAVNVAARVEQLTKETGDTILITEWTRAFLSHNAYEPRGAARLRGKATEIQIYGVPVEDAGLAQR
ncbi:MAG: adenylate/guanylate cyclase domain-containing protein [Actinomycetota bacterium]